jgi:transcriptional regulator with XRE-family HTH domain
LPLSLAQQRLGRGISLEAIAQATKISRQFLEAIEAEEFEKLPGGIFNTSYIRQYAAFTGIDELSILERYIAFINSADPASLPPAFGDVAAGSTPYTGPSTFSRKAARPRLRCSLGSTSAGTGKCRSGFSWWTNKPATRCWRPAKERKLFAWRATCTSTC